VCVCVQVRSLCDERKKKRREEKEKEKKRERKVGAAASLVCAVRALYKDEKERTKKEILPTVFSS